jgi:hypothetical protein
MSKLADYISSMNIVNRIGRDDIEKTQALLEIYVSVMRQSARRIDEMDRESFEANRQSILDFVNLAVDFDHEIDKKRIAERLCDMGHNMALLEIMDEALVLMKSYKKVGDLYFRILEARYFDAYCDNIERVCFHSHVARSTYYRNLPKAVELYAATLWCIVIPDYALAQALPQQA